MDLTAFNDISPIVNFAEIQSNVDFCQKYIDPDYVLSYAYRGANSLVMMEKKYDVTPGCLVLIPPKTLHWYNAKSAVFYTATFDLYPSEVSCINRKKRTTAAIDLDPREASLAEYAGVVQLTVEKQKWFEEKFLELSELLAEQQEQAALHSKGIIIEMINAYLRGSQRSNVEEIPAYAWKKIDKAIQFIHENYSDSQLSNKSIAQHTGFTENYLISLFSEYMGTSVHRYINILRIKQACSMIRKTDNTFAEIAEQVGFVSQQTFCKAFQREMNCTAGEYRQRYLMGMDHSALQTEGQ